MFTHVTTLDFGLLGWTTFVPQRLHAAVTGLHNYDSITIRHHLGDYRHPVICSL